MIVSHIVATDKSGVIGRKGALPWHIPEDLRRFKSLTFGHCMIMGRKTFESIGRPLPGRKSLVVTRNEAYRPCGVETFSGVVQALSRARALVSEFGSEVFIVGGGQIYQQTIELTDRIYLTTIEREVEGGDAFYPGVPEGFQRTSLEAYPEPEPFSFAVYDRLIEN